jgi:hypothetical protein
MEHKGRYAKLKGSELLGALRLHASFNFPEGQHECKTCRKDKKLWVASDADRDHVRPLERSTSLADPGAIGETPQAWYGLLDASFRLRCSYIRSTE